MDLALQELPQYGQKEKKLRPWYKTTKIRSSTSKEIDGYLLEFQKSIHLSGPNLQEAFLKGLNIAYADYIYRR